MGQQQKAALDVVTISVDASESKKPEVPLRKKAIRVAVWIFLVGTITCTPFMMGLAYKGPGGISLKNKFAAPTVHFMGFIASFIIGLCLTGIIYRAPGIKLLFDPLAIWLLSPVSIGYAGSEALALFAMRTADPILYAVIHKMRLLETALMTRIFLRRKVTPLQWLICITVTFCVLAFVFFQTSKKDGKRDVLGPVLLVLNITLSVACSIYADYAYKKLNYPLIIQMPTGRITAALASLLIAVVYISIQRWWRYGFFGGPDGGWDYRVGLLMLFNIVRDWTTCFVLMELDALWKALAGSVAVSTTYLVNLAYGGSSFSPALFSLVMAIMFAVAVYAVAKKIEAERNSLRIKHVQLTEKLVELQLTDQSPNTPASASTAPNLVN